MNYRSLNKWYLFLVALVMVASISCERITDQQLAEVDRHRAIGNQYLVDQKYQDALIEYSAAIDIISNDADLYIERANVFVGLQAYRKAIQDLEEANRIDPENLRAHSLKGFAFASLGEYRNAVRAYDEAIVLDDDDP